VDTVNNIVYAYTDHFSLYAIFFDQSTEGTSKKIYVTSNPVIANLTGIYDQTKGTTFKIDYTAADVTSFNVQIFTTRGRKVFDKTVVNNTLEWFGLNNNNDYLGSGLYIYKATVVLNNGQVISSVKPIGLIKQ
jgi:hypothetical protein